MKLPRPNKFRFMHIGSRIGLVLGILVGLFPIIAMNTALGAVSLFIDIDIVGLAVDCLGLILVIVLAIIGFYVGMLVGFLTWTMMK